jgi:predicted mannosyl-3-phosphoglycerate phosphatase (HAD superfamily)
MFIDDVDNLGGRILEGGRFMHLSGRCDKGMALSWLLSEYQQDNDAYTFKSIAIGDSSNDISMLEVADIALMIASPSHDFPELKRQKDIYKSSKVAPLGWVEGVKAILADLPHSD